MIDGAAPTVGAKAAEAGSPSFLMAMASQIVSAIGASCASLSKFTRRRGRCLASRASGWLLAVGSLVAAMPKWPFVERTGHATGEAAAITIINGDESANDDGAAPAKACERPPAESHPPSVCPLCCEADLSDPSTPATALSACGHRSCNSCLARWVEREELSGAMLVPGCPFCRAPICEIDVRGILGRAFRPRTAVESPRAVGGLDDLTRQWMEEHTVACPGCGHPIEKADGCDLMECLCGYRFCYRCGQSHLAGGTSDCDPPHEFYDDYAPLIEDGPILDAEGQMNFRACIERREVRMEREDRREDIEREEWERWRFPENVAICTENGRWLFSSRTDSACASMLMQQLDGWRKRYDRRIMRLCGLDVNVVDDHIRSGAWLFRNTTAGKSEGSLHRLVYHSEKLTRMENERKRGSPRQNSPEEDGKLLLKATLFVFPAAPPVTPPASSA